MKYNIFLLDITHETKQGLGSEMMPLQLGLIASYCLKNYGDKINIDIFKFLGELEKTIQKKVPSIIGASNFLWNIDLTYKIVSMLKEQYPEIIVIFGGPNYPVEYDEQVKWLKRYPNIDFYIYMDGEVPFSNLVGYLLKHPDVKTTKRARLQSCHSLIDDEPYFGETAPRLKDLNEIPSPYTNGLMDKFFDYKLVPTMQTNRGCPFSCTFCTEGDKYFSKTYKTSLERKKSELDYIVSKNKHAKMLRITDSNFGMYQEDKELCEYIGVIQKKTGYPEYLGCSAGKNNKDLILECNNLVNGAMRLAASVQSLDPDVLKNVKRKNISIETIIELSDKTSDTNTNSYSDIILALPSDTLEAEKRSIMGLINVGISGITQLQLSLIHGAEISSVKSRKKYKMKTMFRPLVRCVGYYAFQNKNFVSIETEEICVATETLSFNDYLEARRLYLTVGLFYNDRIFGEIHALLRLLRLSTWEWIYLIHNNIYGCDQIIQSLYNDYLRDTENELWDKHDELVTQISQDIDKYMSGISGGSLIYKYRVIAIVKHFQNLHDTAFSFLRKYLQMKDAKCGQIIKDMEKLSFYQKSSLLDTDLNFTDSFEFDLLKMINDVSLYRNFATINDIKYPITVCVSHDNEQKEAIQGQIDFYDSSLGGLRMLLSRYPLKWLYRKVKKL